MSENYKYWKFYPTENVDLGSTDADIFEGDYTPSQDDRIVQGTAWGGASKIFYKNKNTGEWGRTVQKKVNGRIRQVWEPGVFVGPITITNPDDPEDSYQSPVWFCLKGDIKGVVLAKLGTPYTPEES